MQALTFVIHSKIPETAGGGVEDMGTEIQDQLFWLMEKNSWRQQENVESKPLQAGIMRACQQ